MDMSQAWLVAAATATPSDPVGLLVQYGVLGIFAALLVIFTRGSITREREKYDQAQAQIDKLNEFIRTELLPKQVETAMLHRQVAEALEEAVKVITEMRIRDSIKREGGAPPGSGSLHG